MNRDAIADTITEFLKRRGLALVRRRAVGALGVAEEAAAVRELATRLAGSSHVSDGTVASEIEDGTTDQVPLEVIEHARALCRGDAVRGDRDPLRAPIVACGSSIQEAVAAVCALPLEP